MGVFDEELHISGDMDMHKNRSIVFHIKLQILYISSTESQLSSLFLHSCPCFIVLDVWFVVHVNNCIILSFAEPWDIYRIEKLFFIDVFICGDHGLFWNLRDLFLFRFFWLNNRFFNQNVGLDWFYNGLWFLLAIERMIRQQNRRIEDRTMLARFFIFFYFLFLFTFFFFVSDQLHWLQAIIWMFGVKFFWNIRATVFTSHLFFSFRIERSFAWYAERIDEIIFKWTVGAQKLWSNPLRLLRDNEIAGITEGAASLGEVLVFFWVKAAHWFNFGVHKRIIL